MFRGILQTLAGERVVTACCSALCGRSLDGCHSTIVDSREPVLNQCAAVGAVGVVDPQVLAEILTVGHQTLAVAYHTADAAAGTRHYQSNVLACHLRTMMKEVGL